jgi:hypothetical protein
METQEQLEYLSIPKRKNLTEEDMHDIRMLIEKQICELDARGKSTDRWQELKRKIEC